MHGGIGLVLTPAGLYGLSTDLTVEVGLGGSYFFSMVEAYRLSRSSSRPRFRAGTLKPNNVLIQRVTTY